MAGNGGAVDFTKLLKEAKQKARLERLRLKQQQNKTENETETETQKQQEGEENKSPRGAYVGVNHSISSSGSDFSPSCVSTSISNSRAQQIQISSPCIDLYPTLLHDHLVSNRNETSPNCPNHIYYIPKFLTDDFSHHLLSCLQSLPHITDNQHSKDETHYNGKWTHLKHAKRNVAVFNLSLSSLQSHSSTLFLQKLSDTLLQIGAFPKTHPPNHILINEYQPHEGIMAHTDGPIYLNHTATFSIGGGDVLLKFTKNGKSRGDNDDDGDGLVTEVKLDGSGSLVVFTDDAYTYHCHSIQDRDLEEVHNMDESSNSNNDSSQRNCIDGTESYHINQNSSRSILVERTSSKCLNAKEGAGEIVKRGYRVSLTFRHKYVQS